MSSRPCFFSAAFNSGTAVRCAAASDDTPEAVSPAAYQGTMHLIEITEGNRTLIEWSVALDSAPQDADRWRQLFQSWIPDWTHSLARALARREG